MPECGELEALCDKRGREPGDGHVVAMGQELEGFCQGGG